NLSENLIDVLFTNMTNESSQATAATKIVLNPELIIRASSLKKM
ncbi:hypothetical protein, partial [Mucilaginibacter polytrichastri]